MNIVKNKFLILFVSATLLVGAPAFSENQNPCPVDQLGPVICSRVDTAYTNPLENQLETSVQEVAQLGGDAGSAAQLTGELRNVALSDINPFSDPYRFQLLSHLMAMLGGDESNISSMFQNLDPGAEVQNIFTNTPYPECNFMSGDIRKCVAPLVAQVGWIMDLSDMDDFNQMGNVGNIAGQLFGQYNVAQGGNSGLGNLGNLGGFGNLGGLNGLLGMIPGASGMNGMNSMFGMFGNGNMQNGNLLGTILMTIGQLTGNENLMMAGQVINTLGAMFQNQNQPMAGIPGMSGTPTANSFANNMGGGGATSSIANAAQTMQFSTAGAPGTDGGNLACMWALNNVVNSATGKPISGTPGNYDLSTVTTLQALQNDPTRFTRVDINNVMPGNVCVAATEYGSGGSIAHRGHGYIVGQNGSTHQNSSSQASWVQSGTISSAVARHGSRLECYRVNS